MAPPLSLFPSQALDHQLKTIALEKFSFAVNLVGSGSHQWVHETRADELFLVFRAIQHSQGEDRADGRLAMSVSVGNQILVSLTLILSSKY
jgi:hypothetical protein